MIMAQPRTENRVAVFIDFENIKRAVDEDFASERVDFQRILDEVGRIASGRIVVKRAYADWGLFRDYRSDLLDSATEPVQTFSLNQRGKNGADIRMAVDVMEYVLRHSEITHVALVSGDSDFTPLVMKLRELGRMVIGVGVRAHTSNYLARSCDRFVYYDELQTSLAVGPTDLPDASSLIADAMDRLGNRPVPGSSLKQQIRRLEPRFDEALYGHATFLEFLRARGLRLDISKPTVGDITVAPQGLLPATALGADVETFFAAPVSASSQGLGTVDRYRLILRDNNFRYVPYPERISIIEVLYSIFYDAEETGAVSLKEAKDRLHAWFESNRPAVSWDSINSTVYHLFYTWCFAFDRADEEAGKQLWDRRTTLQGDIESVQDLVNKCERGMVRKVWEREREDTDTRAMNQWLFDGVEEMLPRVESLVEHVTQASVAFAGRTGPGV